MKILYLSSSEIGLEVFYSLLKDHEITGVITQTDKPQARSKAPVESPIAAAAKEKNITVFKKDSFDASFYEELKKLNSDYFITFSFGIILKKDFFDTTKFGGLNIHPSMLPLLRGPSPIQSAILNGFTKSGITIQRVGLKVDSGAILLQKEFEIDENDDAASLEKKVAKIAPDLILAVLSGLEKNDIKETFQEESSATYCRMIKKEDGLINWNMSGKEIINRVRACVKWPIAHTFIDNNRINIYKALINDKLSFNDYKSIENGSIIFGDKSNGIVVKAEDSLVTLDLLQQSGKKILQWKDFLNGYRNLSGMTFKNGV